MAFNVKDDPRLQQRLHGAPALLSDKDIDAPPAELPALESLVVRIPAPAAPGEDEILERYRARLRAIATITARLPGEPVGLGDEACLSTVGHHQGALVPGLLRAERWTELLPDPTLLGFIEQLVGTGVGAATVLPVLLSETFPTASLRNRPAAIAVRVHAARAVDLPHPEAAETIAALGIAASLEETLEALGRELLREREDAAPLAAVAAVMDALGRAAIVEIAAASVDAEIRRAWRVAEGDACLALGLTVEEQQEAQKLWLSDASLREEAQARLKRWAALKTIVERDALVLTEEGWQRLFAAYAPALGKTAEALRAESEKDPKARAELEELAFRMQVVDYVVARAQVTFVD